MKNLFVFKIHSLNMETIHKILINKVGTDVSTTIFQMIHNLYFKDCMKELLVFRCEWCEKPCCRIDRHDEFVKNIYGKLYFRVFHGDCIEEFSDFYRD